MAHPFETVSMSPPSVEHLRQQLLDCSEAAREARIDGRAAGYTTAKGEVEQTLALLRESYRQNPSLFSARLLDDIRTCKICAGIITQEELDEEATERAYEGYVE